MKNPEGYATPINESNYTIGFNYIYQYKDHLGNIRLSYTDVNQNTGAISLSIVEENNYYPFGLEHKGYNNVINGTENDFHTYNGKEHDKSLGLNWHDYGARRYDASLGRWMSVDPLSQFPSPYNYTGNNPVNFIDPDGRYSYNWNTNQYENSNGEVVSWEEVQANNFEEPNHPEDIIFRDLTGKEVARYVTIEFNDEVIIPLYLSIGFSSIDLNKKYEGLDLDDLDAIGLTGGFGYYFGMGGGKSWEVVFFMDGENKGQNESYTTKSSGIGLEGKFGTAGVSVNFYDYLNNDSEFNSASIEGVSYTFSGSYFYGGLSYTHDSDLPPDSILRSAKTILGSGKVGLQSVNVSLTPSRGLGGSWTRNVTTIGID